MRSRLTSTDDLTLALEKALDALRPPRRKRLLVRDIWDIYLSGHVRRRLVPSGQDIARYSWQNLAPHFGHLTTRQVTQARIYEYEDARGRGMIGRPSKPVTVRREVAYLFAAMRYAARRKSISFDEIELATLPPAIPVSKRHLSIEELEVLFRTAASARLLDNRLTKLERYLWVALETGARKTAILNLTWSRVDLERGWVDFNEPDEPVTNKRRATVAISSSLRPVLERARDERQSAYVLDNPANTVWSSLQIIAARAFGGEPTAKGKCPQGTGIGPHTLRHTAASLMARNGVPLFVVAGVLGNSAQVVERVYAHHAPADPSAVDRISGGRLPPPRS